MPLDTAIDNLNAFPAEPPRLFIPAVGGELSVRPDDSPPGQPVRPR